MNRLSYCYLRSLLERFAVLAVLLGPFWLGSCSRTEEAATVEVVARVGEGEITVDEFNAELQRRISAGRPITDKAGVLQDLIREELLVQRARKAGLDKNPEVRRQIRKLLIGKLREQELNSRLRDVEVSEQEIKSEYEQNVKEHTRPAKVRVAMLHLSADPKMSEEKLGNLRKQLADARDQVMKNPPARGRGPASNGFGSLAIDNSGDQASRYRGGDIGWLDVGKFDYRWPREVLEAAYALKNPSDCSKVIETQDGFYLVMKTDSREALTTPLTEVEKGIKHRLMLRKREEMVRAFEEGIKESMAIEINRDALAAITVPDQVMANADDPTPPDLP